MGFLSNTTTVLHFKYVVYLRILRKAVMQTYLKPELQFFLLFASQLFNTQLTFQISSSSQSGLIFFVFHACLLSLNTKYIRLKMALLSSWAVKSSSSIGELSVFVPDPVTVANTFRRQVDCIVPVWFKDIHGFAVDDFMLSFQDNFTRLEVLHKIGWDLLRSRLSSSKQFHLSAFKEFCCLKSQIQIL